MKKYRVIPFLALASMSLTSCGFFNFFNNTTLENKKVTVYETYDWEEGDINLEDSKIKDIDIKYLKDQELIPYITLEDYFSLFPYMEGVDYKVVDAFYVEAVQIGKFEGDEIKEAYYVLQFDNSSYSYSVAGYFASQLENAEPSEEMIKGLEYNSKLVKGSNISNFSYSDYGITNYRNNSKYYYPISFLNMIVCEASGLELFYDSENLFLYSDSSELKMTYQINGEAHSPVSVYTRYVTNKYLNKKPAYLIRNNRELFIYMMDKYYGLRKNRNISSFRSYYREVGLYDKFSSEDGNTRLQAIADAVNLLNDDHTGFVDASLEESWNESYQNRRGAISVARNAELKDLKEKRKAVFGEDKVRISNDNKTAMVIFDGFGISLLNEFKNTLESLSNTDVENVIIDISTNGGGYLVILYKLLCLISKTNIVKAYDWDDSSNAITEFSLRYDSNDDEQYDESDCYGDDFNFYILSSKCSFSCGNAFPCYSKIFKSAKIIGENSGGGECSVAAHHLNELEYIQHSSNSHIGYYHESLDRFSGFEAGAVVDYSLEYDEFYNIELLNTKIMEGEM